MTDEVEEPALNMEPSVFVDTTVLTTHKRSLMLKEPQGLPYTINNATHYERDTTSNGIVQFELHAGRRSNLTPGYFLGEDELESQVVYCSTSESDGVEDVPNDDADLIVTIQKVPHGVVINSNVFLTDEQWNTIVYIDKSLLKCIVCDMFTDLESCLVHIDRESHRNQLYRYKPIAQYDLSITRQIRECFHCGVCNQTFGPKDENAHFASPSHEDCLLSAVNKVSDIELSPNNNNDITQKNNDCYHFNASAINNINFKNDNYYTQQHFNAHNFNDFDDSSVTESYNDEDYEDDENDGFWGLEDQTPKATGSSYATMLKKPKLVNLPEFIVKDLGNKRAKVRFDSYHMLITPKPNRFYCMACKDYSHLRAKPEHCIDSTHLSNLSNCKATDRFGDYFIREVEDKLYHCGHCNNLVLICDIEDHLERRHSYTNKTVGRAINNAETDKLDDSKEINSVNDKHIPNENCNDNNSVPNDIKHEDNDNIVKENASKINKTELVIEKNNNGFNRNHNLVKNPTASLDDLIDLTPCGYKIAIQLWAFHVICKREYDYYCGLCNYICAEDSIVPHVCSIVHIQMLQRTPFIVPFNCHLIRAVREKLHCAICNVPVAASFIYTHIQEPIHKDYLTKALSVNVATPIALSPNNTPHEQEKIVQNAIASPNIAASPKKNTLKALSVNVATPIALSPNNTPHEQPKRVQNAIANPNIAENKKNTLSVTVRESVDLSSNDIPHLAESTKTYEKQPKRWSRNRNTKLAKEAAFDTKVPIMEEENPVTKEESLVNEETSLATEETEEFNANNELTYKNIEPTGDMEITLNESIESVDLDFEDYVYVKIKNTYFKISLTSYNSLVHIGGSRYCFVCSSKVYEDELKKHIESRDHVKNVNECKFLEKYDGVLLRQVFLMYHCGTCNVLISRRELKNHLIWPTHNQETTITLNVSKKARKNDLKSGKIMYVAVPAKEVIYLNEKEPKTKIKFKVKLGDEIKLEKKKKIVIIDGDVLKINFENWHSICKSKVGLKCQLCLVEFCNEELARHLSGECHFKSLEKPFKEEYMPHLLREIHANTLHCLICNTEVSNKPYFITEHVDGKRHKNVLDLIRQVSSETNAYTDCDTDVLQL